MRIALTAFTVAAAIVAPTAAFAQSVIVQERSDSEVIVREPSERRVIVREPEERVIVREPRERIIVREPVRRYVVQERRPSIRYERRVVVGDVLPESVDVYETPDSDYRYTVLNERRYIVDGDRRIVEAVD